MLLTTYAAWCAFTTMNTAWSTVISRSFQELWIDIVGFIPMLVVAAVILVVGWAVGTLISKAIARLVGSLRVDAALRNAGLDEVATRGGFHLDAGAFLGGLVKWFVFAVFLVAAFDVLGLVQVNEFLRSVVLGYVPQVIVAVLILLIAAVVADVLRNIVVGAAKAAQLSAAEFLGSVVTWSIWVFAILAALNQLGVAQVFVQTLFTGMVIALSLAFGLAFGLGGQEAAAHVIESTRTKLFKKEHH